MLVDADQRGDNVTDTFVWLCVIDLTSLGSTGAWRMTRRHRHWAWASWLWATTQRWLARRTQRPRTFWSTTPPTGGSTGGLKGPWLRIDGDCNGDFRTELSDVICLLIRMGRVCNIITLYRCRPLQVQILRRVDWLTTEDVSLPGRGRVDTPQ